MTVEISAKLLKQIREHGSREYPGECCGALLGRDGDGSRAVHDLLALDNRRNGDSARNRYLVTAEDHLRIEAVAREKRLEVLGFYHSHPDHPAIPSEFDREHALPWYAYVILEIREGVPGAITGWQLAEDRSRFDRLPIDRHGRHG